MIHKEDAVEAIRKAVTTRQAELDLTGAEYYEEPKIFLTMSDSTKKQKN